MSQDFSPVSFSSSELEKGGKKETPSQSPGVARDLNASTLRLLLQRNADELCTETESFFDFGTCIVIDTSGNVIAKRTTKRETLGFPESHLGEVSALIWSGLQMLKPDLQSLRYAVADFGRFRLVELPLNGTGVGIVFITSSRKNPFEMVEKVIELIENWIESRSNPSGAWLP